MIRIKRGATVKAAILSGLVLCALCFCGCYERNLAPAVEYADEDVERLNEEIEKIDWDE